jgi:hypothetical protein
VIEITILVSGGIGEAASVGSGARVSVAGGDVGCTVVSIAAGSVTGTEVGEPPGRLQELNVRTSTSPRENIFTGVGTKISLISNGTHDQLNGTKKSQAFHLALFRHKNYIPVSVSLDA